MLIEQALYTLPEIMALRVSPYFYESSVSSSFAMSLSMLMASRGIPNPHLKIQQESIYGSAKQLGRNLRLDMEVEMPEIGMNSIAEHSFGYRRNNHIEIKFFRSPSRSKNVPGTANAGALVAELLRLATLPFEAQGQHRDVGRYLLHVYQGPPTLHLAHRRQDRQPREWVAALLRPGPHEVLIDLSVEPRVLVNEVGMGLSGVQLELEVTNTVLSPMYAFNEDLDFHFCLTRINQCIVHFDGRTCTIPSHGYMGPDDIQALEWMREKVVKLLHGDG